MTIEAIWGASIINNRHILIAAAGTGGHIYPGIAVANQFKKNNFKISWLGTKEGMENYLVNKNEIQFAQITMQGFRGKGIRRWLKLPFIVT